MVQDPVGEAGLAVVVERLVGELVGERAARVRAEERSAELCGLVDRLTSQVAELTARVAELTARLGQDSSNSSVPPSKDPPGARTRSLRKKSGRSPGGQPGHPGTTLARVEVPDRAVEHRPGACRGCGEPLGEAVVVGVQARQVFDLPVELRLEVVEHRLASLRCPGCGQVTTAAAPPGVARQVQYGPRVSALGVHLSCSHYVATGRASDLLGDLFGRRIGPGTLTATVRRAAAVVQDRARDRICGLLAAGPVAHADETGFKVAGKNQWAHVLSSPEATWVQVHPSRGTKAVDDIGVLPTFTGTLVHDAWGVYDTYHDVADHQLCCAHVLRELQAVTDHHAHPAGTWCWAAQVADALTATIADPTTVEANRYLICSALAAATGTDPDPPGRLGAKHAALRRRLTHRLDDYLRFTTNPDVPATNNPAEQEIRTVKVKQKVSGGMRTLTGANAFTTIRSYLSTARKHGIPPLQALTTLTSGDPWLPATP